MQQYRFAHDRRGRIDGLHIFRICQQYQPHRSNRAIGAISHGGVDARRSVGCCLDGDGGVAASQRQQLVRRELEAISCLKSRQGVGPFDKFSRCGQFEQAACRCAHPSPQIVQCGELVGERDILPHGNRPGVVGGRSVQPDNLVFGIVERLNALKTRLGIFPGRILFFCKDECAVAGVFGVNINRP